jgi:hypothetical protein
MSIIPIIYNQGTGLINPIGEGSGLPIIVDDLVVNGNLTVLGTSQLIGDVSCDSNLTVASNTTTEDLIVNNNTILDNGVGQNNSALIKLPSTNGVNGEVLTITNDSTNPIITEWQPPATINDYVQYDTLTSKLKNNVSAVITNIDDLTVDNSIGLSGQRFKLPSNTTTASNNQVLAILNSAVNPKTTSWVPQSIFNITTNSVDNSTTGTNILNNVVQTIINTPLLSTGIYIINYELLLFTVSTSRNFTYQNVSISTASGNINTVIPGLRVSSSIPYASTIPSTLFNVPCFTGSGVVNITSATTLYLISLNIFTGSPFTAVGFIRYTKIS